METGCGVILKPHKVEVVSHVSFCVVGGETIRGFVKWLTE